VIRSDVNVSAPPRVMDCKPCVVSLPCVRVETRSYNNYVNSRTATSIPRHMPPRPSIALYGNVRCPGRGHDIVKFHDIVGAPTISCRHDIVSPPTILLREYDIVLRSCYRVCVRYRARGAISSVRAISRVRVVISYASSRYRGRGVVSCLPALS